MSALRLLLSRLLGGGGFLSPPAMEEWRRFRQPLRTVRPNAYRIKPGM